MSFLFSSKAESLKPWSTITHGAVKDGQGGPRSLATVRRKPLLTMGTSNSWPTFEFVAVSIQEMRNKTNSRAFQFCQLKSSRSVADRRQTGGIRMPEKNGQTEKRTECTTLELLKELLSTVKPLLSAHENRWGHRSRSPVERC